MKEIINKFQDSNLEFYQNEELAKYTNYKVGGPADILVFPKTIEEIQAIVLQVSKSPYKLTVIGKGSNLLVSDDGIRGVVLKLDKVDFFECLDENEGIFEIGSGANLVPTALKLAKLGYAGFEFASGIPGNFGGSIYMNAGAHGSDFNKILVQVTSITKHGDIKVREKHQLFFEYRKSMFHENEEIIISCQIKLQKSDPKVTRERVKLFRNVRISKQPYDLPSCGSVFKNPPNLFAGELVELSGLKGFKIGGAQVSNKHANFIVNFDNAKAQDIYDLINYVKKEVYKNFEIQLQTECRFINF